MRTLDLLRCMGLWTRTDTRTDTRAASPTQRRRAWQLLGISRLYLHNIKLTIRVAGKATATAMATAMLMLPGKRS